MDVIGVKPRCVQSHRPTAVETPAAIVTTAQRVGAAADVFEVVADGRSKAAEQRSDHRVGTSHQILSGFRAMAQRLKQLRMAIRVVQAVETDLEVRKKNDNIRAGRRRLEL